MSGWEAITWDTARAGGFTAYLLVTLSVLLGLALSMRWQLRAWPRLISYELHVWITNLSFVFLGIHILASWIDPFTRFGLGELLLPFVSHYRPFWMALGIVALYLSLAVTLSLFIRKQIGYTWWLRLHELSFAVWGLATIHGLATGSDTRTLWGIELYIVAAVLVCGLLCVRLLQPVAPGGRIHPVWAGAVAASLVVAILWTAAGPLRPGWNTIANNGNGSGGIAQAAGSATATPTTPSATNGGSPFSQPFTDAVQGTLSQQADANTGQPVLLYDLTMTSASDDSAQGVLRIQLWEQNSGGGDDDNGTISITATQVTLSDTTDTPLYQGQLAALDGGHMVARLDATQSGGPSIQLTIDVQSADGTVTGSVSGTLLAQVP